MKQQLYAEEQGLLGSLSPGQKKLLGKTFYLDSVKKRPAAVLLETITLLGGAVESFLHKDVSFVVTGSQEYLKQQKCTDIKAAAKRPSDEVRHPVLTRESVLSHAKQQPATPRPVPCGSRGKALLEKAIRNSELQKSSVLTNARSWGVKILYVDDVLLCLKQLTRESFSTVHKRPEKTCSKQQSPHVIKAATLRSPYLKIEDMSRKYKPLHMQSMTFPSLWYLGRFSPFESPPPKFDKNTDQVEPKARKKDKSESSVQDKPLTPLSCNPSPWRPRKKDLSYCECCRQSFSNLDEHLQSDQHRSFALDISNYIAVDQLVAEMVPEFNPDPCQESEDDLNRPLTPLSRQAVCELEPLNDAEVDHAIQALQRQTSSLSASVSNPGRGPCASGPDSPSLGVSFPLLHPATPPADVHPITTDTAGQIPDSYPQALSPAMPVLDVEPQTRDSACQPPDAKHLYPCSRTPCPSTDPYSSPPVLSPQVPYPSYIMEPHSPYSDLPVLSPKQYTAETAVEELTCEMKIAESVHQLDPVVTVPITSTFLTPVDLTNGEGVEESNLERPELRDSMCGSKRAAWFSHRSRSLPRQSTTARNPKKRCRSASPAHSCAKRRRTTVTFGSSGSWNGSLKPEGDILDDWLFDKVSCQVKLSCPSPRVSSTRAVQTQVLNSLDIFGCVSSSCVIRPSWRLASIAKNCDPPHQCDNSPTVPFNQESLHSLSHSTSVCIESALIPDLDMLSSSSSDSDWDCEVLSRLGSTSAAPLTSTEHTCELDKELLHRPCTWMQDSSYESRLHTVLQPPTSGKSLCGDEMDSSAFSRRVVKIVEVQH